MKKLFILLTAIICLSSCGSSGSDSVDASNDSNSSVHVASPGSEYEGADMFHSRLIGETLYYIERTSGEGGEGVKTKVIAWSREGERKEIAIFISPKQSFIHFTGDEGGNLYFLYTDEASNRIYLQKKASDGSLIYLADAGSYEEIGLLEADAGEEEEFEARQQLYSIMDGAADRQGQVCFYDAYHNILFLFDEGGTFLGTLEPGGMGGYDSGVVNAGEGGIYAYRIEDGKMLYQKLDWENKVLERISTLELEEDALESEAYEGSTSITYSYSGDTTLPLFSQGRFSIMDGYDQGFLISSSDTLWRYDLAEEKLVSLLHWTDPYIGLSGDYVEHISILDDERVFTVALSSLDHTYRQIWIEIKPEEEVPVMQTITLGIVVTVQSLTESTQKLILDYNSRAQDQQIEIKYYSLDELYMALLKGEGPDLLELSLVHSELFGDKGICEDLSPYMDGSTLVQEEDLIPSIIRNSSYNGKLIYIIPEFSVKMLAVAEKDMALDKGWTPEEVLDLAEANPDISLEQSNVKGTILLGLLLYADIDSFIDWEKKECYFDSERFISLLERVENLKAEEYNMNDDYKHERFLEREYLITRSISIDSIDRYAGYREALEGFGSIMGYPTHDKIPHFILSTPVLYSINSASQNKEGAWSFLEFLLSEEYQTKKFNDSSRGFSPRKDLFEKRVNNSYLELNPDAGYFKNKYQNPLTWESGIGYPEVTDADKDAVRFIVDNAYLINSDVYINNAYHSIIVEEVDALIAGDKSAEEAARIIQSRISLMVKE